LIDTILVLIHTYIYNGNYAYILIFYIYISAYLYIYNYRSKLRRFQVRNRTHKPAPYSADRARRRRWVRFMSRSDCVDATLARMRSVSTSGHPQINFEALIPRIQNSLARVHSTRMQVEALMTSNTSLSAGPSSGASSRISATDEVQSFLLPLQVHIQEVLAAFEALERQQEPPPAVVGVLKKLRNDVIKEQVRSCCIYMWGVNIFLSISLITFNHLLLSI